MKKLFILLAGLTFVCRGECCAYSADDAGPGARAATPSQRGPGKKVTAVGTVEPEAVFDVGAQVTGQITELKVDYGSNVESGAILARIDKTLYQARVDQEQAGCAIAQADLAKAMIDLEHALEQWHIAQEQHKSAAVSDSDYNLADFRQKAAKVSVARAEAVVAQNKAALQQARIELDYTTIRSPVKGVVIDRRVNVGQTLVASSTQPSLFLIGNLDRLQVWASVKETDIAKVHPRQYVRFTVDAYPGKVFEGEVKQVRLNATMFQNSVAYTVVVGVSSATEKLLPYMTAELEFE